MTYHGPPTPRLSFEQSGIDDEYRSHMHVALYQCWVYWKIIQRTGLRHRANEYGWTWGDPSYFGMDPFSMYSDQLSHALLILDVPLKVSFMATGDSGGPASEASNPESGGALLVPLDPELGESLTEEDFLIWFEAKDQATLDLWREKITREKAKSPNAGGSPYGRYEWWRDRDPGPPRTLAEQFDRGTQVPTVALAIRDSLMESDSYTYELIFELVNIWREDNFVGRHTPGQSQWYRDRARGRHSRR